MAPTVLKSFLPCIGILHLEMQNKLAQKCGQRTILVSDDRYFIGESFAAALLGIMLYLDLFQLGIVLHLDLLQLRVVLCLYSLDCGVEQLVKVCLHFDVN
ncbi:hypothetical protein HG530_011420 [Fusarium avenaceum]|nr:hypothetical protein HG530_011420 [Fusarium avenaceum]